ncbi:MAG: hypothetical protein WAW91_02375 [Candidatus Nanoperiomorbaceae bacterium]
MGILKISLMRLMSLGVFGLCFVAVSAMYEQQHLTTGGLVVMTVFGLFCLVAFLLGVFAPTNKRR